MQRGPWLVWRGHERGRTSEHQAQGKAYHNSPTITEYSSTVLPPMLAWRRGWAEMAID